MALRLFRDGVIWNMGIISLLFLRVTNHAVSNRIGSPLNPRRDHGRLVPDDLNLKKK